MNPIPAAAPPLEIYLLGLVDFDDIQQLQRRLVYDLGDLENGGGALILCEHPPTISVGRSGSRAHILLDDDELRGRGIPIRWINRGGGCVLHMPGQLVGYLALPLTAAGLDVRGYLDGLHRMLVEVLSEFDLEGSSQPSQPGVFLGNARVASVGVAVNRWIAYHGFTLNVSTFLEPFEGPRRAFARSWSPADSPDVDGVASPASRPDGEGSRGGDPPGRRGLRPGTSPPLHASSLDSPEGRHACLRSKPRMKPVC